MASRDRPWMCGPSTILSPAQRARPKGWFCSGMPGARAPEAEMRLENREPSPTSGRRRIAWRTACAARASGKCTIPPEPYDLGYTEVDGLG